MRHHSFASWPKSETPQSTKSLPGAPPVPAAVVAPAYSDLLKRELLALADERGVSVSSRDAKTKIIAALEAADG